jgi:hypothetical protein
LVPNNTQIFNSLRITKPFNRTGLAAEDADKVRADMVLLIAYDVTSFTVIKTRLPFVVSPSAQDIAAGPTIKVKKTGDKVRYFMCFNHGYFRIEFKSADRVAGLSRKLPNIQLVTIETSGL